MSDTPIRQRIERDMNACCYREHCRAQACRIAELDAERDVLRARIDGAPTITLTREDWIDHAKEFSADLIGRRVRLVVDQEGDKS